MTTIGIACGQLQSILKFRSSLFKGLRSVRRSLTKTPQTEKKTKWQSDSTTTGEADCLIQSVLKFRSSLFKGLRSVRQSLTKKGLAGYGAAAPKEEQEKKY